MVNKKSLDFLPQVFRTNTNRRFLNATMDQLIQEPNMGRIYGYIGRQDLSPAYRTGDAYVQELDSYSQYYQLEPGLVINKRISGTDNFRKSNAYNYVDLLNGVAQAGGINTDHSRLFAQEYYNYEGFVDLDKLINYGRYYWIPNGPKTLYVSGGGIPLSQTFDVTRPLENDAVSTATINRNIGKVGYKVDYYPGGVNPTFTLVRGGTYTFKLSQPGHPFWIQTEPGLGAGTAYQDNIIKREVFGVNGNGTEVGTMTFTVPSRTAQSFFEDMAVFDTVDLVSDLRFSKLQNADYDTFMLENNIDGLKAFTTKTIVLTNESDDYWYDPDNFDDPAFPYDVDVYPPDQPSESRYDRGVTVPKEQRRGIWQIQNLDGKIKLTYVKDWPSNTKLFVREGREYGHIYIFKDTQLEIFKVPNITAPRDVFYYQDGIDANVYGEIRLVDPEPQTIVDVNNILGQKTYTSPNGIVFSSGLKVKFTGSVIPVEYQDKEYVVEGVGKSITLVPWENLVTPDPNNPNQGDGFAADGEPFDSLNYDFSLNAPLRKDYIVINRASVDGNAWSRTNRWFHEDVIRYSATFADPYAAVVLDNNYRGIRPIVEFDPNLRLWNYGNKYVQPVTVIDTYITDVANQVEGRSPYVLVYSNRGTSFTKVVSKDSPANSRTLNFDFVNDLSVGLTAVGNNVAPNTAIESIDYDKKVITLSNPIISNVTIGSEITFNGDYVSDDVALEDGTKVIFVGEKYQNVRNKIYSVKNIFPHSSGPTTKTTTAFSAKDNLKITLPLEAAADLFINMKVVGPNFVDQFGNTESIIPANTVIMSFEESVESNSTIVTINNKLASDLPVGSLVTFSNDVPQIHLIPEHVMSEGENVVATSGLVRQSYVYWWHNESWKSAQQKTSLSQSPLFDVYNLDGISWGDTAYYPSSSFAGSKLFGYKEGTGTRDKELGFPLSYRSIGNIGDIVFQNFYDTDTFSFNYNNRDQQLEVSKGYVHETIPSDLSYKLRNNWIKVEDLSKQFVEKKFTVTDNKLNDWPLDVMFVNSFNEKNVFVHVNGVEVHRDNFSLYQVAEGTNLVFNSDLTSGDVLVVRIAGTSTNSKQNYTLPVNLVDNSANDTFETLTLGQIRNHLQKIAENSLLFSGEASGNNNLRDIDYKIVPGRILQHSAGVNVAQLMFNNDSTNIIDAIDFNRRAYSRFKDRFFYLLSTLEFADTSNARECLDTIIEEITVNSSAEQAFYYTSMLPYGKNNYVRNDYPVYDTNYRKFNLITPYDTKYPSYRGVLVYLNNHQLLMDVDYIVDGAVVQLSSTLDLQIDDVVSIFEYDDIRGCMVPATPTKLGLYPKFTPQVYSDDTYIGTTIDVVQGHDGSKTIAFNDYRDNILLEFEKRIYNNIELDYTNDEKLSFSAVEPGAFRKTDYDLDDWTQLLSSSFLSWAGTNNINVFENNITQNDPFSFNYGQGVDRIFGEGIPGYWRGIYKYFYDTDRPHTHPWEMLGLSQKPDWWEVRYGPAPYSAGNEVLWGDLELGLVYQHGSDSYVDTRYARPGLMSILPVDEHGELLPPVGTVVQNWNQRTASSTWRFGDQSPQETAWRRSSEYPFAVQIAWALARPAQYCNLSLNRRDLIRVEGLDQIINKLNANRKLDLMITDDTQYIPGSNIWIRDRLADLGLDITENFTEVFQYHNVNLVYKSSGYSDKSYVQVIADQASPNSTNTGVLIPQENYELVLTKSAPVGMATYSAVVVEKNAGGFSVRGFDINKPYFVIIPRRINNNFFEIKVSESTATIYEDDENNIQVIPYGTQMTNKQQVVDFLVSYGKYLTSIGFQFIDTTSAESVPVTSDWMLSVKEFLYWIEQGWDSSTVISLTPAGTKINFDSKFGIVDELTNSFNGSRILDSDGIALQNKDYTTYRTGTAFELLLKDPTKGIHLVEISVVQYEHTLVFDNTTVFNDVIYEPSLGNRQYRMKITGFKTRDWDGSLYAPGFMINHRPIDPWLPMKDYYKGDIVEHKNTYYTARQFIPGMPKFDSSQWYLVESKLLAKQLIPNLAFNAQQFENFYDVDTFDVNRYADLNARNSTGFVPRDYLSNMGLDNISQHKFYLGMIREKGTQAAVNAFLRAKLPYLDNEVKIDEQWAIRLGGYGGIGQKDDIELSLAGAKPYNGAYIVELLSADATKDNRWNAYKPQDLLIKPAVYDPNVFAQTAKNPLVVATAGPVLPSDAAVSVFDIQKIYNINSTANVLGDGSRIWVASDKKNDWNIYRVSQEMLLGVVSSVVINDQMEFTTNKPHGLKINDNVLIQMGMVAGTGRDLSGYYRVNSVGSTTFRVPVYPNAVTASGTMSARLLKLLPVRYADRTSFAGSTPPRGWKLYDQVWIDGSDNNWEVLANRPVWESKQTLTPLYSRESEDFGNGIDMKFDQDIMVAGAPGKDTKGYAYIYRQAGNNTWGVIQGVAPDDTWVSQFGFSVKYNNKDLVAIGAPGSNSNAGLAYVMTTTSNAVGIKQVLSVDGISTSANFGYSVASSQDGNWIAVGAPGINLVYVYKYVTVDDPSYISKDTQGLAVHLIPSTALSKGLTASDISVKLNNKLLVPYLDYTIVADNLSLIVSTVAGDIIDMAYESWYQAAGTITNDEVSGSFGYSISFSNDGSQLAIGAPDYDVSFGTTTYTKMGAAYLFERIRETFIADGVTAKYILDSNPVQADVYVDGVITTAYTYNVIDNSITLGVLPSADSIVTVENSAFALLEKKTALIPQSSMNFGAKVVICPNTCSWYVGAPGYNNKGSNNGTVYRYVNAARLYGAAVAQYPNAPVTVGSSIRLNGVKVTFTGTTLSQAVADINAANIPGVSASLLNNAFLKIASASSIAYDKLIINKIPGSTALADLGITVFDFYQQILSNSDQDTLDFGKQITLSTDASKLLISATLASNKKAITFDRGNTTFDLGSTNILSVYYRSGNAYLYEYQGDPNETSSSHGNFVFAQSFTNPALTTNNYFGTGVSLTKNWAMITALHGSTGAGTIYTYYNRSGLANWAPIRNKPTQADSRKIDRLYLYNDNSKTLIADLPILDPEHGIPVPSAAEQIRYIVNYDPAIYTNTPNTFSFAKDGKNAWGAEHVGELWWDTNRIKYTDWNQGDLLNKFNTWGLSFPNSYASVYEWIESDVAPSQYATMHPASGPLYTINDVYTTKTMIDEQTLQPVTKYYFWVVNNNENNYLKHKDSALALQNLISNPRNINEPFAAVISSSAVALFNCKDIVDNDTRLHIQIKKELEPNTIHEEWSMFDDGTDLGVAVEFLDRLNDSLAGEDAQGRTVPDSNLTEKQKYGISIRPRQTTFADRFSARETWVNNVNAVFIQYPMALLRDISSLSGYDPEPLVDNVVIKLKVENDSELEYINKTFYHLGDQALVLTDSVTGGWTLRELSVNPANVNEQSWEIVKVQKYDLRKYWTYADWYATQYSADTVVTKILDYEYEISNADPQIGDIIKIKNSTDGNWKLVLVNETSLELIGQQNATIQLSSKLYDNLGAGFGLDSTSFEITPFAQDASLEFRNIFEITNYELLTKELREGYKSVVRAMIDAIATQFKQNDWLLKTSLINIKHRVRSLDQIPVYVKQPEDIVNSFLNEVKPFHTKIKQYISSYDKLDLAGFDAVDFDLPPYYNGTINKYRSPQYGNIVDDAVIGNPIYSSWIQNHTYSIRYIDIANAGSGYDSNVTVKISGDGTGASAIAFVRSGQIYDIIITNEGYGYTFAEIQIIGTGQGATAYAKLGRQTARTFDTTLRFDRYTYDTLTKDWTASTQYDLTDIILHSGKAYRLAVNNLMDTEDESTVLAVNSYSIVDAGSDYRAGDMLTVVGGSAKSPAGLIPATFKVASIKVLSASVSDGGTGYSVGNILLFTNGNNVPITLQVTSVAALPGSTGPITGVSISNGGSRSSYPISNPVAPDILNQGLGTAAIGSGAKIDLTWTIDSIELVNSGTYTNIPTGTVTTTTDSREGAGATLTLGFAVSGIITETSFIDDKLIELSMKNWEPEKPYTKDTIIMHDRVAYVALTDFISDRYFQADPALHVTNSTTWEANTFYHKDAVISYEGIAYKAISDFTSPAVFSDHAYTDAAAWEPNKFYAKDSIFRYDGIAYSVAGAEYTSGDYFVAEDANIVPLYENNLLTVFNIARYSGGIIGDAASRVWAYYNPRSGMPGKDLAQVMTGIDYPGVTVKGPQFDQAPGFGFGLYEQISYDTRTYDENGLIDIYGDQAIDTELHSLYTDAQLGLRPEDMITDGAAYIDTNSSHAPEELIPGHMFDTLDIRVKTLANLDPAGSPEIVVVSSYADGFTKIYSFDPAVTNTPLPLGNVENLLVFDDIRGLRFEGIDYDVNWQLQQVEFYNVPQTPSSVYISLIGNSGQRVITDADFIGNGVQTEFEIKDFTLNKVQQAYVKVNNVLTGDWNLLAPANVQEWLPATAYAVDDYVSYNGFTYRVAGNFVSGATFKLDSNLTAADRVIVRFDNPPPLGARIQVHLFDLPVSKKAYSHIVQQLAVVPDDFVYDPLGFRVTLEEPAQYMDPREPMFVVQLNELLLEPSNQAYYVSDGATKTFSLPAKRNISSIPDIRSNNVKVVIDGITLADTIDYVLNNNGVDVPTVTLAKIPARGAKVTVSNNINATYAIADENVISIDSSILKPGDKILITNFSNYDQYDTHVEVLSGAITTTGSIKLGFDIIGFDVQGWENEQTNVINAPKYTLDRAIYNIDYVEVYLNGAQLTPYYDFVFPTPTTLRLNPVFGIVSSDTIIVRHISEQHRMPNMEFRIFKGITETYEYFGIGKSNTTTLAQDLALGDEWIYVDDITVLGQPDPINALPGVIFLNGERITYYILDSLNKRLGQIRRATNGTGAPAMHDMGTKVYDASFKSEIPSSRDTYYTPYSVQRWKSDTQYVAGQVLIYGGQTYKVLTDFNSDGAFTDTYLEAYTLPTTTLVGSAGNEITITGDSLIRQGKIWLNSGAGTPADGLGIVESTTIQGNFLRAL